MNSVSQQTRGGGRGRVYETFTLNIIIISQALNAHGLASSILPCLKTHAYIDSALCAMINN